MKNSVINSDPVRTLQDFINKTEPDVWIAVCAHDGSSFLLMSPAETFVQYARLIDNYTLGLKLRGMAMERKSQNEMNRAAETFVSMLDRPILRFGVQRFVPSDPPMIRIEIEGNENGDQWTATELEKTLEAYQHRAHICPNPMRDIANERTKAIHEQKAEENAAQKLTYAERKAQKQAEIARKWAENPPLKKDGTPRKKPGHAVGAKKGQYALSDEEKAAIEAAKAKAMGEDVPAAVPDQETEPAMTEEDATNANEING